MIHQRKIIKAIAYAILLCFTSLTGAQPLYAIPANTQLPTLDPNVAPIGATVPGTNEITGNTMNIQQTAETSIIKWQDFSIGADATVNFNYNGEGGFNSLNYVMNGPVSEIYGQLTALGGNIFIANPAGVQIGNSAQINVGSLYVTNKDVGSVLTEKDNYTLDDITSAINSAKVADTNAELMSLGSIISTNNNVTFDGNRIVIDTERLYTNEDGTKMRGLDEKGVSSGNTNDIGGLTIKTDNTNDVILGYDGTKDEDGNTIITGDISFKLGDESTPFGNTDTTTYHGYQWIRDLFQLQDIANTESLDGWYALRNSIDASYTANENYKSGIDGDTRQNGGGFKPIGSNANRFTGRFDGLGYDIFGLNINRASETYIGLFGYVGNDSRDNRAYVRNFTLNSGSIIGNSTVGAAIGLATDGTVIENITNTTDVKGTVNVGGIIGTITGSPAFDQNPTELNDLINVGTVEGMMSVGGIAGQTTYASIGGKTYNLGNVIGTYGGENSGVGGIVGTANNSIIGNEVTNDGSGFQIYNQSSVTGQYNVGGIVGLLQSTIDSDGNMGTSEVRNVANHGTVTANGKTTDSYSYHTAEKIVSNIDGEVEKNNEGEDKYNKLENGLVTVAVDAANVGGIVGNSRNGTSSNDNERHITIKNVLNDGDVKTETDTENDGNNKPHNYYIAGNVGGVVGRADDTAIENATNRENSVAGAHNVGGIAGLLTGKSHVKDSTNDGGDITGTGARYTVSKDGKETVEVLKELVRPKTNSSDESFIVGNIGGIVGYMYDDDSKRSEKDGKEYTSAGAFIENSTNRGTVHSAEIPKDLIGAADNTLTAGMKAANVGGIAGKIDMAHRQDMELDVKPSKTNTASGVDDYQSVSIRHSYNTGKVQGYTGVGGVAGMMYNGSVARSFNTGNILSSRQSANDSKAPLNMGGVVGDTTELVGADGQKIGEAGTMIYDVYNAGQIGDETYTYYGRHVGGVVGRLTGEIDKAYNTGDIYNGFNVVGGVVGWWYDGNIRNVFNTGNITVVNNNTLAGSYVGGIVGNADAESSARELSYAYNLGTIRSFKPKWNNKQNYISGILGGIEAYSGNSNNIKEISINNVYTLGNLYAAVEETTGYQQNNAGLSAIWNEGEIGNARISNIENAVYISPEDKSIFKDLDVDTANGVTKINDYDQKNEKNNYGGMVEQIYDASKSGVLDGIPEPGDDNFEGYYWRIYDGTPILNVFLPYAEDLFSGDAVDDAGNKIDFSLPDGVGSVQYGTAYNPLMTIIKFNEGYNGDNLTLDWGQLKTTGTAGLAVYNNGLTLNNFDNNHGRYFGGTIYADGNLTINAATGEGYDGTQFVMSDGAKFYGSSVTVDTQGRNALISGHIEATGSKSDGGDVKVTSGKEGTNKANIEILGQLFSAAKGGTGHSVTVAGVSDAPREGWDISKYNSIIQDPKSHLTGVGILPTADEVYATVVNSSAADPGKVDVTTGGDVSIRYGNMGVGEIRSYGAFSVTASDIYLDSYMTLEDDMNLKSIDGGEILLDFTDAYYDEGTDEETQESLEHIHKVFLTHFRDKDATHDGDGAQINVIGTDKFNIMVDMWGELKDEDGNVQTDEQDNPMYGFDLTKYDYQDEGDTEKHSFAEDLLKLKINFGEKDEENFADFAKIRDLVHIWIEDAEQLAGIQKYYDDHDDTNILSYNFALKNNIDASVLDSFTSIGGEEGYSGTFDGRGFRILGLNVGSAEENDAVDNAGIFTKLIVDKDGHKGTVQDLRVYSSNFYGTNAAGAIAGVNEGGVISGVTTLGNHVEATGKDGADTGVQDVRGAAGGIVGINKGEIKGSDASDVVVAGGTDVTAGGVAGVNAEGGLIGAKANGGGDFEIEEGKTAEDYLVTADSAVTANKQGIFSIGGAVGVNKGEANLLNSTGVTNGRSGTDAYNVDKNVGGVVGLNDGDMTSLYNESIVMGKDNVGGVAGTNEGNMSNAVNATSVTADDKVDEDDKTAGNIGGLAGVNSGTIDSGRNAGVVTGGQNVGGLVGANNSSDKGEKTGILKNLSNALAAVINGKKFVGGIAGSNSGTITGESNLINEGAITGVQFVGGIAGQNSGEIRGGNAEDQRLTNKASINGTQYVGGIAGQNTGTIENTNAESKINAVDGKLDHESENLEKQFFGGVTGENIGIIDNATNTANLRIEGGKFVGGITGRNSKIIGDDGEITTEGVFKGKLVNKGAVYGDANVGGIAGMNQADNVLVGTKEEKLIVSNENTVEAENGGAAGIFHTNSGRIEYAEISNSGKIIGNESDGSGGENTGALFGVNTGSITNSTLKNSGEVTGGKNTGGLIGTNTGNITYSSLINEVGAKVTGTENVGGLIGYNIGMIEGGRKNAAGEDLGLYTYEIYNNGTVSGSANVGGLIGNNAVEGDKTGSLTAGYNTGVVSVTENSEGKNVGGIVGVNAGTIDQVFNTVMTLDENGKVVDGAISGVTNVGGIVGSNTGTLTNAYNTTDVESSGTKGNIAGENSGTVENVYATNDSGTLFGKITSTVAEAIKNAYSFSDDDNDKTKQGITFIAGNGRNNKNSYGGFSISGKADEETTWRIYEGYNTPLLKVFLTDASYSGDSEFVYNASQQGINDPSKITAADERQAFDNVNSLLQNLTQKNAGTYSVWSSQIAGHTYNDADGSTVFDPNNLGYDIDFDYEIKKAQLEVTLDDIYRTYGNGTMYSDKEQSTQLTDYTNSFSYAAAEGTTLNETMEKELVGKINIAKLNDEAVDSLPTGRTTNDAGKHDWSATVSLAGEDILNNYQLNANGDSAITVAGEGKSNVTPAELHITLNQVERTYGDTAITNNEGKYTFTIADGYGLVNGDDKIGLWFSEDYNGFADTALIDDKTKTDDAGTYHWSIPESENGYAGVFDGANIKNYSVTVTNDDGKVASIVNKRGLRIEDLLGTIEYGSEGDIELKENSWKFAEKDDANRTGIVYEDEVTLDTDNANREVIKGSEYALNRDKGSIPGRVTADVIPTEVDGKYGAYSESLKVSGLTLSGGKAGNYFIIGDNGKETDTVTGGIEVTPAELTIQLGDVERVYGDTSIIKGEYGLKNAGLKNGDNITFNGTNVIFGDDAIENGKTKDANVSGHDGTYMDEAIRYYWNVGQEDYEKVFTGINLANYIVDTVGGESKVAQRELTVSGLLASIVYGDKDGNGLKLKEGATLSGFADGYDNNVNLVVTDGVTLTAMGAYEENRNGRETADVNVTDENGVYQNSLVASGLKLGGDSANNYYIDNGTATGGIEVTPAPLTITLNNVTRTYGDADTFVNGIGYGIDDVDGPVNGDDEKQLTFAAETAKNKDKALSLTDGEWRTSDHGKYSYADGIDEAITGINLDNYEVKYKGGDSIVNKLTLKLSDLVTSIIYGDHGGQGFSDVDVTLDEGGVVYNDEVYLSGGLKITDGRFDPEGEYESDKNGRATANVGNYNQKVSFGDISLTGKDAGNYDVDGVMNAAITVTPAQLTIKADDQNMLIGTTPNFTGTTLTELANQLVNGDSLPDGFGYEFGLEDESILDLIGTHPGVIGLLYNGAFYGGGLTGWGGVFANYNMNVEPGLLTIVPPSTSNYGHLHSDGWDRVRNFRERKAEVFFHKGGMEYDEEM